MARRAGQSTHKESRDVARIAAGEAASKYSCLRHKVLVAYVKLGAEGRAEC